MTKKFQWEVSQIANNRFPCVMLLGGLSVNLNHLKITLRTGVLMKSASRFSSQVVGTAIVVLLQA